MNTVAHNRPARRPLEVNNIDHIIRCYGGRTIANDMEPNRMQHSKRSEDLTQYIDFLCRRNGELRLETTFYRKCFENAEKFKEKVVEISQDLLHQCIIGLLDDAAFDEIRDMSKSIVDAVEEFQNDQELAVDAFVAPYKGSRIVPRPDIPAHGMI
ncbi:hypothetical protein CC86DRAFT_399403 [Ophiobolus disseminans]|uniref:Uncharacterized protein n=1 Tax=Ophiobolus disseminans TaxID=1469910 RepID=A0A6A6ZD24_9PLEO|nr:hypothetical protein CC86DRAFT_399403 [Ophiobolus disseminans]